MIDFLLSHSKKWYEIGLKESNNTIEVKNITNKLKKMENECEAVEYQKTCANNKYILGAMGLGKSASIKQVYEESQENCVYENSN